MGSNTSRRAFQRLSSADLLSAVDRISLAERLEPRRLLALAVESADLAIDATPTDGIEVTFNGPVDHASIGLEDVRVENLSVGTGQALPEGTVTAVGTDGALIQFDPSAHDDVLGNQRLPDGYYELSLWADGITDPAGNPLKADAGGGDFADGRYTSGDQLWFLNGDFNRDSTVDLADFGIYRSGLNNGGTTFAEGDATGDGVIDLADFGVYRAQHGRSLEAPPTRAGEVLATLATEKTVELAWVVPSDPADRPDEWHIFLGTGANNNFASSPAIRLSNTDVNSSNDYLIQQGGDGLFRIHHTVQSLIDGVKYWFDVRGWSSSTGLSPTTDAASETTLLPAPSGLYVAAEGNGTRRIAWTANSSTHTSFELLRRDHFAASWEVIASEVSPFANSADDLNAPPIGSGPVQYAVRARNDVAESAPSVPIYSEENLPRPDAPENVRAVQISGSAVEITWNAVPDADKYFVYRGGDWLVTFHRRS
ncbi:MAG: hypothetical protein AAF561_01030 [Planctomycetota bacterium]